MKKTAPKILTRAMVLALRWKICDIGRVETSIGAASGSDRGSETGDAGRHLANDRPCRGPAWPPDLGSRRRQRRRTTNCPSLLSFRAQEQPARWTKAGWAGWAGQAGWDRAGLGRTINKTR